MILIATTITNCTLAFHVEDEPTDEDRRRLAAIQSEPGVVGATWSIKPGTEVR